MTDPNAIRITFLGTSSGMPTRQRNVSGVAVQFPQRSEWWLFDCGEGTQHQLLRLDELRPSQLRRILSPTCTGITSTACPGLLASCGLGSTP